jgi:tRNA pseudouridine38-40 synthase
VAEEEGERTGRNILLVLEYDGSRYAGFQWQPNAPTVQAELETAIERLSGEQVRVTGAGRTDAGVHARGQVVSFATGSRLPANEIQRALNALLPPDIAVLEAREVAPDVHPRFSAVRRAYRYTILNTAVRSPLLRATSYHVGVLLNVDAMNEAAQALVGRHDFAAFGGPMRKGGSTVRTVYSIVCRREGDMVIVDIEANAYLSRMVRHIVGTLLAVGRGALPVVAVAEILESRDRNQAQAAAPAQGLCLMDIGYAKELR